MVWDSYLQGLPLAVKATFTPGSFFSGMLKTKYSASGSDMLRLNVLLMTSARSNTKNNESSSFSYLCYIVDPILSKNTLHIYVYIYMKDVYEGCMALHHRTFRSVAYYFSDQLFV